MSQTSFEPRFDVASGLNPGRRDYQEDSLITDFPVGSNLGFAVLADGMGGHAAGDVASKIIVTEIFSELKFQSGDLKEFEADLPDVLWEVTQSANECIRADVAQSPDHRGMGSTLIAPIFVADRLYWMSIGDSPLYLIRDGAITQLNEDHSMAPQIDLMFQSGIIDAEAAMNHPDRNCLTSVLCGGEIAKVDCPRKPFQTRRDDIYIVSSDGLQFLKNDEILEIVHEARHKPANRIAARLLAAISDLEDPDQDNVSFSVIKVNWTENEPARTPLVLTHAQLGVVNG